MAVAKVSISKLIINGQEIPFDGLSFGYAPADTKNDTDWVSTLKGAEFSVSIPLEYVSADVGAWELLESIAKPLEEEDVPDWNQC